MTIGKKLYLNFGAVLAMVVVLFLINLIAVQREHSAKAAASQALQMAATTDKIRFQMMQNRLSLSNYLLSGDTREVERLNDGMRVLEEKLQTGESLTTSEQQRTALDKVQASEQNWAREFAAPLMDKRKEVDSGNATVAELQIFYLQKDASSWVKNATEYLDVADLENTKVLEARRKSDETAGTATFVIALLSTLVALTLGVVIAYTTAKSITSSLMPEIWITKSTFIAPMKSVNWLELSPRWSPTSGKWLPFPRPSQAGIWASTSSHDPRTTRWARPSHA
jgi:methyl-accepting chemotaxis protein WspA